MKDSILDMLDLNETSVFDFREVCGFTFVFKTAILSINDALTSASIRPVGIIYEENDEFYLAFLDEADDINVIVEEFVKKCLLR